MAEGPLRVRKAGDDAAHDLLLTVLGDATLRELHGEGADLDRLRVWSPDPETGRSWSAIRGATARLRARQAPSGRPFYRSRRLGAEPEGAATELLDAVVLAESEASPPDLLLILLDEDGEPERHRAAERVKEHLASRRAPRITVVLPGVCEPTAEGWLIPLLAQSPRLRPRIQDLHRALGFDPAAEPHRLSTRPKDARHHAKRVARAVLDPDRRPLEAQPATTPSSQESAQVLAALALDLAPLRGLDRCGLAPFLSQLREHYTKMVAANLQGS